MKELQQFPECDGHIESILIGCRMVKVSFQTWNAKRLVLIYDDVEMNISEANTWNNTDFHLEDCESSWHMEP